MTENFSQAEYFYSTAFLGSLKLLLSAGLPGDYDIKDLSLFFILFPIFRKMNMGSETMQNPKLDMNIITITSISFIQNGVASKNVQ